MRRSPASNWIFAARSSDAPPACPTPRHMPPAELSVAQRVALAVLRAYKVAFSPMYAGACRFVPSCSEYAAEAVARHGVVRGSFMAARRLARCNPFGASGLDPVPGAGGETR
jgi:uncharacterized protein